MPWGVLVPTQEEPGFVLTAYLCARCEVNGLGYAR